MRALRTLPTVKLLALGAALFATAVLGTGIALGLSSASPPAARPLAVAVRQAMTAPPPAGLSARVTFVNRLVDSSLAGDRAGPLLAGGSGRLWVAPGPKLRLELQSDRGDTQLVVNGRQLMLSDPASSTVYRATLPARRGAEHRGRSGRRLPSLADVQRAIDRLGRFASVAGPSPGVTAGRPSFTVRVAPLRNHGLLAAGELTWDAAHGIPLRLAVFAKGVSSPVLELKATDIQYGPVADSTFSLSAPADAHVSRVRIPARRGHESAARARHGVLVLHGRPLLGGVVVFEHRIRAGHATRNRALGSLPRVQLGGTTAHVLSTPLGTILTFQRAGVSYTVAGLVPESVAKAAAASL